MIMICHQTICMYIKRKLLFCTLKQPQHILIVWFILKNVLMAAPSIHDMQDLSRIPSPIFFSYFFTPFVVSLIRYFGFFYIIKAVKRNVNRISCVHTFFTVSDTTVVNLSPKPLIYQGFRAFFLVLKISYFIKKILDIFPKKCGRFATYWLRTCSFRCAP